MISAYLNGNELSFAYDSANRLISAGQNSYTYNVEDVRVRNLCGESETTYAYNTNGRLSQLLAKTTDGVIMTIECRNNTSLRHFYAKLKIWHQIFFENLSIFIAMKLIQNRRAILYSRFYRLVENSKSFRHSIIIITKYVYGLGLIGEETGGSFKTYHFDYRGSTAAITDINGNVTDTFEYDTYGNLISRAGTSAVIFLYNGRDGVVTDSNGLIYMRARYYSPELRRFINADIIAGEISNAVTLNRYAYANGNPVSNTDPFGLSAERGTTTYDEKYYKSKAYKKIQDNADDILLYSWYFGVDPNIVAGVIFKEQYSNYDWIDVCTDWVAFYGVIDMSVGLGQVRVSIAKFLEEQGYVPETSAEEGGWNIPFIGFVHGTETMAREKRLEDNSWNIMYVAAYIKYFEDTWIDVFPEISSRPDILGTLYNIGHEKTSPNSNPGSNKFGDDVEYFYDLMGEALK